MSTHPKVSFLIANWNGGPQLAGCLTSIRSQTLSDYEVIVVDNGSTDGSAAPEDFSTPDWQLVTFDSNQGFAKANNAAYLLSRGEFIALVNNDVILDKEWAERMVAALSGKPKAGSAACRLLQKNHPERLDSAGMEFVPCGTVFGWHGYPCDTFCDRDHNPFGAVAAACMYRRSAIEQTGLFDEKYFCYYEDTSLAVRQVLFGYDAVYVDAAIAYHHGSFTGKSRSAFQIFYLRRNVELLYWETMIGRLAWRFLIPHIIHELLAFAQALLSGHGIAVVRAKWAAMRCLPWIQRQRRQLTARLKEEIGLRQARANFMAKTSGWLRNAYLAKRTTPSRAA